MELQWHHNLGGITQEWVFSILPTERKEYIAVGYTTISVNGNGTVRNDRKPVIMKLDKLGRPLWIKPITYATEVGGPAVYDAATNDGFGLFEQVVKTPNGYMACGLVFGPFPRKAILTEVDENGNILTSRLYNAGYASGNAYGTNGRCIAINGAQTKIYIGGEMMGVQPPPNIAGVTEAYISQIDGSIYLSDRLHYR